jgi:hypothetical protein
MELALGSLEKNLLKCNLKNQVISNQIENKKWAKFFHLKGN